MITSLSRAGRPFKAGAQHMPKKERTEEPGMFDKEFSMAGPQVQNAGRCVRKKEGADSLEEGRARL